MSLSKKIISLILSLLVVGFLVYYFFFKSTYDPDLQFIPKSATVPQGLPDSGKEILPTSIKRIALGWYVVHFEQHENMFPYTTFLVHYDHNTKESIMSEFVPSEGTKLKFTDSESTKQLKLFCASANNYIDKVYDRYGCNSIYKTETVDADSGIYQAYYIDKKGTKYRILIRKSDDNKGWIANIRPLSLFEQ